MSQRDPGKGGLTSADLATFHGRGAHRRWLIVLPLTLRFLALGVVRDWAASSSVWPWKEGVEDCRTYMRWPWRRSRTQA